MNTLALASLLALCAHAVDDRAISRGSVASEVVGATGVVVKVDGASVVLDLGAGAVAPGARFEVLEAGDELKHPVTGESLGPLWERRGAGAVTSVEEKYSLGSLSEGSAKVGWKARLAASTTSEAALPRENARSPVLRSPFFAMEALELAVGDVDGDGSPDAVLADADKAVARRMSGGWEELCAYEEKATGSRILSAEAYDLDGDGRAEVFVSVHNRLVGAVETHVLDCRGGRLVRRESLPWLVRSYGAADGTRALAAQALEPDSKFPASGVYRLRHGEGKYSLEKPSLRHKRLEWAYGFAFAPAAAPTTSEAALPRDSARSASAPMLLHFNQAKRLVLRFAKGAWTSPEAFGFGTGKLLWHGSEFHFHPRLLTRLKGDELESVHTTRNIPRLLGLASAFGLYSGSELHRLAFNGMNLETAWKAELPGTAAGLDRVPGTSRVAVAVAGANGRTAVWLFDE